jgi:hypothetical protein
MSKVFLLTFLGILLGCSSERDTVLTYKDGEQQLNVNSTDEYGTPIEPIEVILTGSDTVKASEPVKFRMHLNSSEHELLQAYFNCRIDENSFIDTLTTKIRTCSNRLPIRSDSVIIEFTAGVPGRHKFLDLTLISRDKQGTFRYHKATFNYYSIE